MERPAELTQFNGETCGSHSPFLSLVGVHRGDPSSPALFALLTASLLSPLHAQWLAEGLNAWGNLDWEPETTGFGPHAVCG